MLTPCGTSSGSARTSGDEPPAPHRPPTPDPGGDRVRPRPFGEIGARGVFVKELEEALLAGRIDVAVHSAKDMTSTDVAGLSVGGYTAREDPRDAFCGAGGVRPGMRIGTASVRRRSQLLATEPQLFVEPLR